tara:strand:- start:460 stop:1254 length:795 start_codon:yes stop_codon:yes gene_type:complete
MTEFKRKGTHPQIEEFNQIPQKPQKSEAWLNQRKNYLTSSDAATALGINPYQNSTELLFSKCGMGKPFNGNDATRWGEKYEDEAIEMYCNSMGMVQNEFGLIPLECVKRGPEDIYIPGSEFLAGSPDGVALEAENEENCDPVLLEVKCPKNRKIKMGHCPKYYVPQVQLNMYILNLRRADFIEYKPSKNIEGMTLNVVRYHRDDAWLKENVPKLKEFWNTVLYYREKGIHTHPEYVKYAWTPERIAALELKNKPPAPLKCLLED